MEKLLNYKWGLTAIKLFTSQWGIRLHALSTYLITFLL